MRDQLENYETVKSRKKKFYAKYPEGRIIPEIVVSTETRAVFKVSLYRNPEEQEKGLPLATGHAEEFQGRGGFANKFAWTENCEESAVGRALDNAGFAGQTCSREEIEKVKRHEALKIGSGSSGGADAPQGTDSRSKGVSGGPSPTPSSKDIIRLKAIVARKKLTPTQVKAKIKDLFGKESSKDLNYDEYHKLCTELNGAAPVQFDSMGPITVPKEE